ncbi:RNA polymerase sigma factor RpoD/SigA, partial [Burkholderia pseudomallei]
DHQASDESAGAGAFGDTPTRPAHGDTDVDTDWRDDDAPTSGSNDAAPVDTTAWTDPLELYVRRMQAVPLLKHAQALALAAV